MKAYRDQIRRDAEMVLAPRADPSYRGPNHDERVSRMLAEHCLVLLTVVEDLLPSPDGLYGPNNAADWKDAHIARILELRAATGALERIAMQGIGDLPFVDAIQVANQALRKTRT